MFWLAEEIWVFQKKKFQNFIWNSDFNICYWKLQEISKQKILNVIAKFI